MNLSVKNMILAFVVGLVVFSLLMLSLCVGMFNSEIEVAKSGETKDQEKVDLIDLDKAIVFKADKKYGSGVDFFVLVLIDNSSKKVLLTPIYGDYLIPYKNALSYVSSVYSEIGNKAFPEIIRAFSGISLEEKDVFDVVNSINYESFKSNIFSELENAAYGISDISEYQIEDFYISVKENQTDNTHERIRQIDTEQSVKNFRTNLGKN